MRRRNVLPKETSNYLPIILAMVIMAKSPAHYGLDQIEIDPPLEYSTVELDAPLHLNLVADITERPVSEIRELNPALLTSVAPAGHSLHVPLGSAPAVLSALELIPASRRAAWRLYRVSEGDTLDQVARTYRTTAKQIAEVNSHTAAAPEPGSLLVVPAPPQPVRQLTRTSLKRPAAARKRVVTSPRTAAKAKPKVTAPGTSLVASKKAPTRRSSTAIR
jgi:membrane-bound lytic murein transglycosylase D